MRFLTKPIQIQLVMLLLCLTAFFVGGLTIGMVKGITSKWCEGAPALQEN